VEDYRCLTLRRTGSAHRFCQDRFQIWAGEDRLILYERDYADAPRRRVVEFDVLAALRRAGEPYHK